MSTKQNFNYLASRLASGSQKAGKEIFEYFGPKIYRFFAIRILHRETSEDLTQEVFLRVVKKINTFDHERGDFETWLWSIARNLLVDHYRGRKNYISVANVEVVSGIALKEEVFAASPDMEKKETADQIIFAVESFSKQERDLFSLHYISGVPYKELSKIMNRSEGSLRVAMHRLNKRIRKLVKK